MISVAVRVCRAFNLHFRIFCVAVIYCTTRSTCAMIYPRSKSEWKTFPVNWQIFSPLVCSSVIAFFPSLTSGTNRGENGNWYSDLWRKLFVYWAEALRTTIQVVVESTFINHIQSPFIQHISSTWLNIKFCNYYEAFLIINLNLNFVSCDCEYWNAIDMMSMCNSHHVWLKVFRWTIRSIN